MTMQAINYSEARNNLKSLMDQVCEDYEPIVITRKNRRNCVMLALDEYNAIQETLYLLSSRANRERLLESIEEIEKGGFSARELIEA
jgi:antitoxin YefM